MMEAASTSETSVNFYQTTRLNNPEDSHLQFVLLFRTYGTSLTDKKRNGFYVLLEKARFQTPLPLFHRESQAASCL
jgi:hypothetical protein